MGDNVLRSDPHVEDRTFNPWPTIISFGLVALALVGGFGGLIIYAIFF